MRSVVHAVTCIALSGCAAAARSGVPVRTAPTPDPSTWVLVHGAWGGGWQWSDVERRLRARGHDVRRVTLTGLGERVHLARADVGLDVHVEDVVNAISWEDLRDVVLLGHSYGGIVIAGAAERVPERIRRLVFVDAYVPEDGDSLASLLGARGGSAFLASLERGDFYLPPGAAQAGAGREPSIPRSVAQPRKTFQDAVRIASPAARALPATYVLTVDAGATTDAFEPDAERAARRGWRVVRMEAGHMPHRTAPEALVDLLDPRP